MAAVLEIHVEATDAKASLVLEVSDLHGTEDLRLVIGKDFNDAEGGEDVAVDTLNEGDEVAHGGKG